jgi:hypothetical protein
MIPTPTANPTLYPTQGPSSAPQQALAQRWVCLQALPCSNESSGCVVGSGAADHRVKLSVKTTSGDDAKPLAGKDTWIFECLQTGSGYKCTTGDPNIDTEQLGMTNYPDLHAAPPAGYGYSYGGIFFSNGVDPAPNPIPTGLNNNGDIGTYEWESYTDKDVNRLFLAMNKYSPNGDDVNNNAQQQGIIPWIGGASKKCIQIKWDPTGVVIDANTNKPLSEAMVALLKQDDSLHYSLVTNDDVLGGIQNPVMTDSSGKYNFMVPDGSYKIVVKKDGYEVYSKEVIQSGKQTEHNVTLEKKKPSVFENIQNFIEDLFK